jgi:predicted HD phosphohydrolase
VLTDRRADVAYPVDRVDHSLQTATRAQRDGADEDLIVCALLHDIGESLGPMNHGAVAAATLKQFICEQNRWVLDRPWQPPAPSPATAQVRDTVSP